MDPSVEIEFAIAEVLASKGLMLINDLSKDRGQIRANTSNVLIRGRSIGKHHIQTTGAVIVDTSIDGGIGKPCRIEATGDVIITGSASNLHVTARSIHIGGQARFCRCESLRNTVVEGDLVETHVILGDLGSCKSQINHFDSHLRHMIDQRETFNRQIARDANQLHKACKSARFNLSLTVGRMIQHDGQGLEIDLGFFYEQITKTKEEEIQAALIEFFNRGIIGVLSRTNRTYFTDSPARERLFIKTLSDLRKLVLTVRKRDILALSIDDELEQARTLINHLEDPRRHLSAHGRLSPNSSIHFSHPQIKVAENGSIAIGNRETKLRIRAATNGSTLHQTHLDGQSTTVTKTEPLCNLYIGLDDNTEDAVPTIHMRSLTAPPIRKASPNAVDLKQTSVLVVSDSPFMADLAIDELNQRGFTNVEVAENGYTALDALRDQSPHVAFFDLTAPNIDGDAFLKLVRTTKGCANLGIAVVVRKDREEDAIKALENGADEYLLKPLQPEEFVHCIERLLHLRSIET
ncbi:MAG: CheY-like chemotaxis protein [Candidatus Latescibacterota bacterium]|jgi:CheY-like chemotaxis protein